MPMIDVYAPADLFPADADRALGEQLTLAVLRAEGVTSPGPFHADNTAAYVHRLPASAALDSFTFSRNPARMTSTRVLSTAAASCPTRAL